MPVCRDSSFDSYSGRRSGLDRPPRGRGNHHDHVLADCLDQGRIFDCEPVGHFHQHLRRAGLGRVNGPGCPIERLAFPNQLLGFSVVNPAWVGQLSRDLLVTVQLRKIGFIADQNEYCSLPSSLRSGAVKMRTRALISRVPDSTDTGLSYR